MNHFPLFADLKARPVLVVGGGSIAERKIQLLRKAQAEVFVVAKNLTVSLQTLVQQGEIIWLAKEFQALQIKNVFLVVAATNDKSLNQRIFHLCESQYKLVNSVDDPEHANFIFPSIIDRSPIQIAISSGGNAPVLARLLREKLEALLPQYLGNMAEMAGQFRDHVKATFSTITQRRRFWESLFNGKFAEAVKAQQTEQAQQILQTALDENYQGGSVTLVGAGPGDAGLLTLKGLQEIQAADVVLYDALVSEEILELVRRDAELINVGKRAQGNQVHQNDTNQLLVDLAKAGKKVVRLKGGDPFVFGRGGEELEILAEQNIPFSVVPGITAAIGATAYAGIPLTHRDYAQSAIFVTGHRKENADDVEWQTLAKSAQTLVIYMGSLKAGFIAEQLQKYGRNAQTPVAIISNGTKANQKTQVGCLSDLPKMAEKTETPALIVVGEVVALQEKLAWFGENLPKMTPHFLVENHQAA